MVYVINDEHLTRRKLVTIDGSKVTSETSIPLGLNINLPGVSADGSDTRLAKLDGTPIAREIECVGVPNAEDVMIWYPFNTIASTDSQFYVYWGNSNLTEPAVDSTYGSEAVWSGHIAVWHMNQEPFTSGADGILDSTGNNHNGTPVSFDGNSMVDTSFGKGIDFQASSQEYIDFQTIAAINNIQKFTVMIDIDHDVFSTADFTNLIGSYSSDTSRWALHPKGQSNLMYGMVARGSNSGNWYVKTTWNNRNIIAMVFDGSQIAVNRIALYEDGVLQSTSTYGTIPTIMPTTNADVRIGYYQGGDLYLDGVVGEARLISDACSDDHQKTTANNLINPTSTGTTPFYLSFGLAQHQRRVPQFIS